MQSEQPSEQEEVEVDLAPSKQDFGEEEENEGAVGDVTDSDEFYDSRNTENDPLEGLRRSGRQNQDVLPRHLQDYDLGTAGVAACAMDEPVNFKDAVKNKEWRLAMDEELESHRRNGTWELVPLPRGRKTVGSRWVYKIKRNEQDEIIKYKARIVAQGHTQRYGEDFEEVFAPVARQATLRTFSAVASKRKLIVRHLDVKTAHLHGSLDEEIFMRQPQGYAKRGQEEFVCRLNRSMYGLRQSARCWCKKLQDVLLRNGFKRSGADPCLYIKPVGDVRVVLIVYVDDMLLASSAEMELQHCIDYLNAEFELTSLGQPRHFLGMEIAVKRGVYFVRLLNYVNKLIEQNGMSEAKEAKTPMDVGYTKSEDTSASLKDPTAYRSLVGGLLYLAVIARPDIAATAAILGRKFAEPTENDWTAAKCVLRFLKGTKEWYLELGDDPDQELVGYSDADWAGDLATRKSTTGFVFTYGGGVVSWTSRRQSSVTLSSMEAEYYALSEAYQETIWLRQVLNDLGERQQHPTVVNEDNQGCLAFVRTERSNRRSKHINTREHFVQELCLKGEVVLEYCSTDRMMADIYTKPRGPQNHQIFSEMLGLGVEH